MDFEFYNVEPEGGLLSRLLRPVRRVLRRIQRPYFHRLRDLLQWLFDNQRVQAQRHDELAAHVKRLEQQYQARIEELERTIGHANSALAAAQQEKTVFLTDYLAVTRRLVRLEDLLIDVLASQPVPTEVKAKPISTEAKAGPSLAKIAS